MLYNKDEYRTETTVFKALGHPARLKMTQPFANN